MRKRHKKGSGQLVCQYLEKVPVEIMGRYPGVVKDFLKNRHGVYALYNNDKVVYVGLAKDLRMRLNNHLRDRHAKKWDSFSVYLIIDNKHIKELESLILRIVKPKNNKQRGKFIRSENIRKMFYNKVYNRFKDIVSGSTRKKRKQKKKKKIKRVKGKIPILAKYIDKGFMIRLEHRGKFIKARVKKDGSIKFKKRVIFTSPLVAAKAITKKNINGWRVWEYERAPGDWVRLDNLRK